MSITIALAPGAEEALKTKALAEGLTLEEFAQRELENLVLASSEQLHPRVTKSLERLKRFRGTLGPIPDKALDPNVLYGDR